MYSLMKVDEKFRKQFVQIVQAGALTFDRKYEKTNAHFLVDKALNIPDELFSEKDYSAYNYATDLLDFQYGLFEASIEGYPEWIQEYSKWLSSEKKS